MNLQTDTDLNDLPEVIKVSKIDLTLVTPRFIFRFASKNIDSCLRQAAEDLKHFS